MRPLSPLLRIFLAGTALLRTALLRYSLPRTRLPLAPLRAPLTRATAVFLLALTAAGCNLDDLLFERPAAPPEYANLALTLVTSTSALASLSAGEGSAPSAQESTEGDRIRILIRGDDEGSGPNLRLDTLVVAPPGAGEVELLVPIPLGTEASPLVAQVEIEVRLSTSGTLRGAAQATLAPARTTSLEVTLRGIEDERLRSVERISVGLFHACATVPFEEAAYCWGSNADLQLGAPTQGGAGGGAAVAQRVLGTSSFALLTAGLTYTCGVDAEGITYCWGSGRYGSLGLAALGEILDSPIPFPVYIQERGALSVSAGGLQTCALLQGDGPGEVYCWGLNDRGQLGNGTSIDSRMPLRVGNDALFDQVSAGYGHTCGLNSDGISCWGDNRWGQLGDGSTSMRLRPVRVEGSNDYIAISAGGGHTCALDDEGRAHCWGNNRHGQLGSGTPGNAARPTPVASDLRFRAISAGGSHTCALDEEGRAFCWGENTRGALGDGTSNNRTTPTPVAAGERFGSLAAGYHFTCGVTLNGEGLCWGSNAQGQLGNGTWLDSPLPVPVLGPAAPLFAQWVRSDAVADSLLNVAGHGLGERPHPAEIRVSPPELALQVGDTAQLNVTAIDQFGDPVDEFGPDLLAWESSDANAAAVLEGGRVVANGEGVAVITAMLGILTVEVRVTVTALPVHYFLSVTPEALELQVGDTARLNAVVVDEAGNPAEGQHIIGWATSDASIAAVNNGLVTAVGAGEAVITVVWDTVQVEVPVTVEALPINYSLHVTPESLELQVGDTARLSATVVDEDGNPAEGSHTIGWATSDPAIATVSDGLVTAIGVGEAVVTASWDTVQVAIPVTVTALPSDNLIYVAGDGQEATISTRVAEELVVQVVDWTGKIVSGVTVEFLVTGGGGTLTDPRVLTDSEGYARTVWTLGGGVGTHTVEARIEGEASPVIFQARALAPLPRPTESAMMAGAWHTCALTNQGESYCWGLNEYGQLGNGRIDLGLEPTPVASRSELVHLAPGWYHTCGITATRAAYCWGDNSYGQLGSDTDGTIRDTPISVAGWLAFTSLTARGQHTCGLVTTGAAYCWGRNDFGQLGDGEVEPFDRTTPVRVAGGHTFTTLSAGVWHVCGLTPDGTAYCWGMNTNGQLGRGTTTGVQPNATPEPVAGGLRFRSIASGYFHTCALTGAGTAYCWGENLSGQLGDDTGRNQSTPVLVSGDHSFHTLIVGGNHSCGITTEGETYCWGSNDLGQVGYENDGDLSDQYTPVFVQDYEDPFVSLTAGTEHTCGLTDWGYAYCWGNNFWGQFGNGERYDTPTPYPTDAARGVFRWGNEEYRAMPRPSTVAPRQSAPPPSRPPPPSPHLPERRKK